MIKKILQSIENYYQNTRAVGHTTATLQGFNNTPKAKIVTISPNVSRTFPPERKQDVITVRDLQSHHKLRGLQAPLVWDNAAIYTVASLAYEEICRLETSIATQFRETIVKITVPAIKEFIANNRDLRLDEIEQKILQVCAETLSEELKRIYIDVNGYTKGPTKSP